MCYSISKKDNFRLLENKIRLFLKLYSELRMIHIPINIKLQSGELVKANSPVIVSASRSTDIPAFYADWYINRLKAGYIKWTNPFNGVASYISFDKTRLMVFWSKNPKPLFKYFDYIDENYPNYYFQYTLNDYDGDLLETKVPPLNRRIETFIELSEKIGAEKVVWRFDPLMLTKCIDVDLLLRKIENIGDALLGYTQKLVFSFADISIYKKVQSNLNKNGVDYIEFDIEQMKNVALGLQELNKKWNIEIATCSEKINLEKYEITHNKCVDDDLIIKLFSDDNLLMDFLGVKVVQPTLFENDTKTKKSKVLKDKGQRQLCGCIMSKDIGQYNTCPHGCIYCYANTSQKRALENYQRYKQNKNSETITGSI